MSEQPKISERDTLIAALWRAVAKTLAQPLIAAERARIVQAAEAVDAQLRLTHVLFCGGTHV